MHKYILVLLNVLGIKKQNIDGYVSLIMSNIKDFNEFNNVIVIPTTDRQTQLKIVYQLKNNNGEIQIQVIDI